MRTYKTMFFAILTLCFSIVAQASDTSSKAGFTLEPQYAVIAGLDMQAFVPVVDTTSEDIAFVDAYSVTAVDFDRTPILMEVSKLSITDKDFNYQTLKVMNTAKMQNQNFDRVSV